jgi:thiol-disulfide isomerase/thioredoxin
VTLASAAPVSILRQEVKAPQFALKDLNGRIVRLSDYKGKVVLINFWATWCPPCRAEMPDLVRFQREHGKEVYKSLESPTHLSEEREYAGLQEALKLTTL